MAVMTVGTAFYAVATGMIAFFSGFWGFWFCMVIMTVGELVLIPNRHHVYSQRRPRGNARQVYEHIRKHKQCGFADLTDPGWGS